MKQKTITVVNKKDLILPTVVCVILLIVIWVAYLNQGLFAVATGQTHCYGWDKWTCEPVYGANVFAVIGIFVIVVILVGVLMISLGGITLYDIPYIRKRERWE